MRISRHIPALCLILFLALSGCAGEGERTLPASASIPVEQAAFSDLPSPEPSPVPVDDSWFTDTAMIGHSLMAGMELYSGLDTPDYYTLTGGSVSQLLSSGEVTLPGGGKSRLADALAGRQYRRFVLFLGVNELAGEMNILESDYLRLLSLVRSNSPDAEIYVLSVLPVTRHKAAAGVLTLERIDAYNQMLQTLCAEEGCRYVDLYACFADEDGYLPAESSTDGLHLESGQYAVLLERLKLLVAEWA